MAQVITAAQAAQLVKDGDTVALSGFGLACVNEEAIAAVEQRFLAEAAPRDLTVIHATAVGNRRDKGMSHWGHPGLIKRWIGGIAIASPALAKIIEADECEAYNLPQGVITQLYREIAAKRPGVITKVGLGTFVDPRVEGARMSPLQRRGHRPRRRVRRRRVALLPELPDRRRPDPRHDRRRGRQPHPHQGGPEDGGPPDRAGGAQLGRHRDRPGRGRSPSPARSTRTTSRSPASSSTTWSSREPENHFQTENTQYNPSFSGQLRIPLSDVAPIPLSERKIIARRCAMELRPGAILNLGVGIPATSARWRPRRASATRSC